MLHLVTLARDARMLLVLLLLQLHRELEHPIVLVEEVKSVFV
jgi:hypothetical protein